MVTTYCGDHFAICTHIESLCCKSETNTMYMSIVSQFFKIQDRLNYQNKLQSEYFPQSRYVDSIQL